MYAVVCGAKSSCFCLHAADAAYSIMTLVTSGSRPLHTGVNFLRKTQTGYSRKRKRKMELGINVTPALPLTV